MVKLKTVLITIHSEISKWTLYDKIKCKQQNANKKYIVYVYLAVINIEYKIIRVNKLIALFMNYINLLFLYR